jgi:RNA polymerase sigma factor (sigma-70 family)
MGSKPDYIEAFEHHMRQVYGFFAYRTGSRADAEDLTQETFERAFKAWERFDPRRAGLRTWLMAIAHNLLIDHYRSRVRHSEVARVGSCAVDEPAGLGIDPALARALAGLGEREREIIALRFGGDLSGPDIAAVTGMTVANVQQILSRSLRRLRAALDADPSHDRGSE